MINNYIQKLQSELITENALEHSYRPALKNLFEQLDENIIAVNEPTRSAHGSPDFVFFKKSNKNIILGYVETKDINVNLDDIEKTSQLKRYLGYSNLILTNYIEFRFFRNGEKYQTVVIANREGTFLRPKEDGYVFLENELKAFLEGKPERIKSGKRLAEIMGGKAGRIRENVNKYLHSGEDKNKELERIYQVMKDLLVHDLSIEKFADMYAQTLVYGLFVARYYDDSPENFTRQEARDLVPASNPFLRHFFDHIIGPNFDKRLGYIVDELCEVFSIADIRDIIQRHFNLFGEAVDKDPIIHFYEDFLKEYDSELRKSMGAYYTPVPVVQFIIRAVDELLEKEFNLQGGVANIDKVQREIIIQGKKSKELVHKVQILDPAVGTATFLNEIIKYVYQDFKGQEGVWQSYVENELLPRLHGFELMMAPYTIAHLKLAMTLKETGINKFSRRLGVYLTNTLEEGIKHKDDLFSFGLTEAISEESKVAGNIKNDKPIMVVIGNPPYSVSSNNKNEWIDGLIKDYKKDMTERNIQPLSDDYIKFIRFGQNLIQKNQEGILAYISNNSFIDGIIHRQMRKVLLEVFDSIYILNLHGNSKKKEISPNGSKDENVFNIQQGVSINIFIKKRQKVKKENSRVFYSEIFGKRNAKFDYLNKNKLTTLKWQELTSVEPYFFFIPRDVRSEDKYNSFIKISELFNISTSGIKTHRDNLVIDMDIHLLQNKIETFFDTTLSESEIKSKLKLKESDTWTIKKAKDNNTFIEEKIHKITYRPFDDRYIYFDPKLVERGRDNIMTNVIDKDNVSLLVCRQQSTYDFQHVFISKNIADMCSVSLQTKETAYQFPLYTYFSENQTDIEDHKKRTNLNTGVVKKLLNNLTSCKWNDDYVGISNSEIISSLNIIDYTYAILYSPKYRIAYKEFLKIDFPRIPVPQNKELFWLLSGLGADLRKLHLMDCAELKTLNTVFPIPGTNMVDKIKFEKDKIWINETQYFGNVPKEGWDFFIGGYQPAQKWLKDRKGHSLNFEDITYYQKIIKVQLETIKIMNKIDEYVTI